MNRYIVKFTVNNSDIEEQDDVSFLEIYTRGQLSKEELTAVLQKAEKECSTQIGLEYSSYFDENGHNVDSYVQFLLYRFGSYFSDVRILGEDVSIETR